MADESSERQNSAHDPEDIGPVVRRYLMWAAIALFVPLAFILTAMSRRDPVAFMFLVVVGLSALITFWAIAEGPFSRRKIRDPRIVLHERQAKMDAERRERDIT
jgi:hypothetical protein